MRKLGVFLFFMQSVLFADEGMWPLNMVPHDEIAKTYGVELSPEWLEHVQKASLRFSTGGSSSFVSPNGLLMTNHHVGSSAIYSLSSEQNDLIKNGFYAQSLEEELLCPNVYADQLISIQDVTAQVLEDLSETMTPREREEARKAATARICKKAQEETGLQPEVVALYRGALYHLYLYKRYTDIRLVMAPEQDMAFFGGDDENFEYPRHSLDVSFFRVYENNEPVDSKDYLKWSKSGPSVDEPLFVLGHPGRTDRILTSDHLQFVKDVRLPYTLQFLGERIESLQQFSAESEENRRIALQDIHKLRNSQKVFLAMERILKEGSIIKNKKRFEQELFKTTENEPWLALQKELAALRIYYADYYIFEMLTLGGCHYYDFAECLVRASQERVKANEKRLREYRESELPTIEMRLFSEEPVYPALEKAKLIDSLTIAVKIFGVSHPQIALALDGKSVEERAEELIANTQLGSIEYRRKLYENPEELLGAQDPFIKLALAVDPYARKLRERYDNEFAACEKESYAQIADILFKRYKESMYPDATFTLRLSVGTMKGYEDVALNGYDLLTEEVPPFTTFETAYVKARNHSFQEPYKMPQNWRQSERLVQMQTPFNFVSTNDIIGGNSGSPVINKNGEVVGIIFDGNRHAFSWDFAYDDQVARAVSVHSQAILEALMHIYEAEELVAEITTSKGA